jgi:hypothetical protein
MLSKDAARRNRNGTKQVLAALSLPSKNLTRIISSQTQKKTNPNNSYANSIELESGSRPSAFVSPEAQDVKERQAGQPLSQRGTPLRPDGIVPAGGVGPIGSRARYAIRFRRCGEQCSHWAKEKFIPKLTCLKANLIYSTYPPVQGG